MADRTEPSNETTPQANAGDRVQPEVPLGQKQFSLRELLLLLTVVSVAMGLAVAVWRSGLLWREEVLYPACVTEWALDWWGNYRAKQPALRRLANAVLWRPFILGLLAPADAGATFLEMMRTLMVTDLLLFVRLYLVYKVLVRPVPRLKESVLMALWLAPLVITFVVYWVASTWDLRI